LHPNYASKSPTLTKNVYFGGGYKEQPSARAVENKKINSFVGVGNSAAIADGDASPMNFINMALSTRMTSPLI